MDNYHKHYICCSSLLCSPPPLSLSPQSLSQVAPDNVQTVSEGVCFHNQLFSFLAPWLMFHLCENINEKYFLFLVNSFRRQ